jgi:hypothetical protein
MKPVSRHSPTHSPAILTDRLNKMVAQLNENFTEHDSRITTNTATVTDLQTKLAAALTRLAALENAK